MFHLDHRASYLAFEFNGKGVAGLMGIVYAKECPQKNYGRPSSNILIISRKDLPLVCTYLNRAGIYPAEDYVLHAVFLENEIEPHEKESLQSKFKYAVAEGCRVCGQPILNGPHKHDLRYCDRCEKETVHTTPFFGYPWRCKRCR